MKDKLKNLKKSYKHTFCILLAAVALSAMAAFGVYAYELPAREYSCNRRIYINLDDGASELMFWMARVDRDCSNYNEGKWLDGVAANEKLKPKYGDERITERYYDNEMPTDSPNGFYEHIDCVGATPYIWIVEPEKENCKFKGWETNTSYEKITYEGYDYWIFSAGAYATDVISGSSGRCEDITIKAVWEPEVYVDYNMNGGYLTSDSSYVASDSGWMRPADGTPYTQVVYPDDWGSPAYDKDFGLKRDGYVFKGWTTVSYSDNVNDLNYRPGVGYYYGDWAADAYYNDYFGTYYVDLYAVWEPIIHVDYNMNGGYLEPDSGYIDIDGWMRPADGTSYVQSVNPDDWGVVYSDAEFKLKRDGYILKGWTTVKGSNSAADINYRPGVGYYYDDWESDAYYNDYFDAYYVDLYAVWDYAEWDNHIEWNASLSKANNSFINAMELSFEDKVINWPHGIGYGIVMNNTLTYKKFGDMQGFLNVDISNVYPKSIKYEFSDSRINEVVLNDNVYNLSKFNGKSIFEYIVGSLSTREFTQNISFTLPEYADKEYSAYVDISVTYQIHSTDREVTEIRRIYYNVEELDLSKIHSRIRYQPGQVK